MTYRDLVKAIQDGRPPGLAAIRATLAAVGKTDADLITDAFADPPARPRQPCAVCGGGRLIIKNTRHIAGTVVRYLGCNRCDARPPRNKIVAPRVPTD